MKLSIAIPTYNRAFHLDKNLKLLLNQYNNNFQVIVQDNYSKDNTSMIIEKYIKLGLPIIYEKNPKNLGWAKNFEICFKKVKTKYMILLGDDDIIINGGINIILENIDRYNPDLIFMNAFPIKNYKKSYSINENNSRKYNLEEFLIETILQFRLISSYVIKTKYISNVNKFTGNFAHLNVVLEILKNADVFIKINNKLIGSFINNSEFDHETNFSDEYVKEFFLLYRKYLSNVISKSSMIKIENKMLKTYLPKLILKSRYGFIKRDNNISQNFDLIFSNNDYYNKNRFLFTKNNFFSNLSLLILLIVNQVNK